MGRFSVLLLTIVFLGPAQPTRGQEQSPATKDPNAVLVLRQALAASGVGAASAINSFAGSGKITYYWAGEKVEGRANVRSRGLDQFRLDAELPQGTRSWVVNQGAGRLKEADRSEASISYHNGRNLGALTLPYAKVAAALAEPSTKVFLQGILEIEGQHFYKVRIERASVPGAEQDPRLKELGMMDVVIDASRLLIVSIESKTHAANNVTEHYRQALYFWDYRPVNGLQVPFLVSERIEGQRTWALQLESIDFNAALSDSDFSF